MSFDPHQPPPNPYDSPQNLKPGTLGNRKPPVIMWQKLYLGCMVALYVVVTIMGVLALIFADTIAAEDPSTSVAEVKILGAIYGAIGFACAILFALGFVFNKGNAGWIFNVVLIALGLTSCCTWPTTIPLLIFWIKDRDQILLQD